ncbi:MAG: O-antigen ligase family protein [Patescibacteria group bacterium]
MNVSEWCDRVIRWGFILLFGFVTLLLTPWNYELFEYNKMMAVYALTVMIVGAWLVKSIHQGKLRITRTPLDIPIVLFFSSQLLSSLFSIDPHVSWFGYYSRFNGGMFSIISYILLYYALVSNLSSVSHWSRLLKAALATASVVALYGIAERFGIDRHLWVQDVQSRVFSTLGQPNWLAAYLVVLVPISMALGLGRMKHINLRSPEGKKDALVFSLFLVFNSLFFSVLLFTRSRSGLLGFAVADIAFWGLVFLLSSPSFGKVATARTVNRNDYILPFIILHCTLFAIVFFNGTSIDVVDRWVTLNGWKSRISLRTNQVTNLPTNVATPSGQYTAPLLETGGTESGTIRKYVWQGAINAWRSSTKTYLIGTGTETFAFAFYQYRPREHNLTSEWDFLYNKAHNEYLNYLATTGIFGLGSYLLFIGVFIVWFIKQYLTYHAIVSRQITNKKTDLDPLEMKVVSYVSIDVFAGWLSILVTNLFGFSIVLTQVFLFLFPAMIFVLQRSGRGQDWHEKIFLIPNSYRVASYAVVILVSFALLALLSAGWYADTLYAKGYRASRAGQYDVAVDNLTRASVFNPGEPLFADELGSAYAGFATIAIEEKNATAAAQFVRISLAASDRAITTSPKNVNFWKTRTKIYYTFSSFDPAFNDASITALEQAQKLSPNDPKITYNLSILYGRKGDNTKAIDLLKSTIDLKPNYRDAYYALWVFYIEVRKPELARTVLNDYLAKVDPGDKDFLERLKQ